MQETYKNRCGQRMSAATKMIAAIIVMIMLLPVCRPGRTCAEESGQELTGTWNVLLIGSDRRNDSWNGNSDTMILVTVNHDVKKIFMVSFMRDLYAQIPGHGVQKLNNAYAVGGADLLEATLEDNFGVHIDNYMAADFPAIEQIIDLFGGVDIDVSEAEASVANDYISVLCQEQGLNAYDYYINGSGMQHLNGVQALGYMRNRYVGNNDYERTARQREVLQTILDKVKAEGTSSLAALASKGLEIVDHDLNTMDVLKLTTQIPALKEYELVTDRIPYDGMYSSQGEMLVPQQPATRDQLLGTIYATE